MSTVQEKTMNADEKIAQLEQRIEELEGQNARSVPKLGLGPFQRVVDDGHGRSIVVTVGGNNGGY